MGGQTRGPWRDQSITSLSGSSQQLIAADSSRQFLLVNNPNASASISFTILATAAANTGGNVNLTAGGSMLLDENICTNALQVIGSAGAAVTCWTFP